ncbi:MAG: IS4 family transposase [Bacteroidota bacterium]
MKKGAAIFSAICKSRTCSLLKSCKTHAGSIAAYRFFDNPRVTEEALISQLQDYCKQRVGGREILALCDSSAINISSQYNRIVDAAGLGPIEQTPYHTTLGFLIHPVLAIDKADNTVYGIGSVDIWNRAQTPRRSRKFRYESQKDPIEVKESMKWIRPCEQSMEQTFSTAKHVTFVMDREGDLIEVFDRLPNEKVDLVVRCRHNRLICDQSNKTKKLFDWVAVQKVKATRFITIQKGHPKRKARAVKMEIKYGQFKMPWPKKKATLYRNHPKGINTYYVQIKQQHANGYEDESPIEWLLLTTKKVQSIEQALDVISIYEKRWQIEVYFKHLKSDGFDIEPTQLTKGKSIRKLILMIMQAALKVEQLKAARDGQGDIRVDEVFDPKEIECLKAINKEVSGATKIQQNPYPEQHLSWASWIIARLGGWTGYNKRRPPGTKTFIYGLQQFEAMFIGYKLKGD